MTPKFDQNAYWIARHEKFRGDPRSVGNLDMSSEENLFSDQLVDTAIDWLTKQLPEYRSVLDIGCGYGRTASAFIDGGFDYTGIDVAPAAIDAARKREPRAMFLLGSALDVPISGQFDVISFVYVLVHFVRHEDWSQVIRKMINMLAPGGAFLIADQFQSEGNGANKHVFLRPLSDYVQELGQYGLVRDEDFKERLLSAEVFLTSPPPFEIFRARR